MRDEELIEQLRENLRRQGENPKELWDALIREGIIDAEGKVLVRMPEPRRGRRRTEKRTTAKRALERKI
jgi:hypothetical protein